MTERENLLRAVRFERPDHIPMAFHINGACWQQYPQDALQELMAAHPLLFPGFTPSAEKIVPRFAPYQRAAEPYTDDWGCTWKTSMDGITGTVVVHPLADWSVLDSYVPPDPEVRTGRGPRDWSREAETMARAREEGRLLQRGLHHGHTFLHLCDLRGYENLLVDMATGEPRLQRLIGMVEEFNMASWEPNGWATPRISGCRWARCCRRTCFASTSSPAISV